MADNVSIDTGQVQAVAGQIRQDADLTLASSVEQGRDLHDRGVMFGHRYPGGAVVQAKQQYADALAVLDANVRNHQIAAEFFAEAADRIARAFAQSDRQAGQAQDVIQRSISEAQAAVGAKYGLVPPSAGAAPAAAPSSSKYAGEML